jgi:hypothetical protein
MLQQLSQTQSHLLDTDVFNQIASDFTGEAAVLDRETRVSDQRFQQVRTDTLFPSDHFQDCRWGH